MSGTNFLSLLAGWFPHHNNEENNNEHNGTPHEVTKKISVKKTVNKNNNDNANDNDNDNLNKNLNGNANLNGNLNINKNINKAEATATANSNVNVNIDLNDLPFEDNDQIDFKYARLDNIDNFMAGAVGRDGNVSQAYNDGGANSAAFAGFNGTSNMAFHAVQINDMTGQTNSLVSPIVQNNNKFSVEVGNYGDAGNGGGSIDTGGTGLGFGLGKGLGVGVGLGGDSAIGHAGHGTGVGAGLGGLGVGVGQGGDNWGNVNSSGNNRLDQNIQDINVEAFNQNIVMGANIGFNNAVAANAGGTANGHNLGDTILEEG